MLKYFNTKLGEILITAGVLTQEKLESALKEQKKSNKRLGDILIENNFVTQQQLIDSLVLQLGIPYCDLTELKLESKIVRLVPETIARINALIPVKVQVGSLVLAVADPLDYSIISDMSIYTGMEIKTVIAEREVILRKLDEEYATQKVLEAAREFIKESKETVEIEVPEIIEGDTAQPIIRFVNMMIEQALSLRASDIHIEPEDKKMRIRFRIDGKLTTYMEAEGGVMPSVASHLKFIGNMNIAEKRIPQDGRMTHKIGGREIDLRISILPSIHGEKVVIRIMNSLGVELTKDKLGFLPSNLEKFEKMLMSPHGIILVTGPTGSGKTTTLYAALKEKTRGDINIITVEDPVEALISGLTQVQVNPKAGLTFAAALRSILRQDPDVVMIGEIRDEETAEIATRVAITGHLVLSTLHTNDAASAILRLTDMKIEPFLVAASLVGVISQRLIRTICPKCKIAYKASSEEAYILGVAEGTLLYKGNGCESCKKTGYRGRIAIHEVMPITPRIRRAIHDRKTSDEIQVYAIEDGMISLKENVRVLVVNGTTTLNEMNEIFYGES